MNKELILKYKVEFDHWLKDGKILYKHKNSLAWWTDNCWNYALDYVQAIIINDKFVEFRKALVEGKEVEYSITDLNGNHLKWVNILDQVNSSNIDTKVFNYELSAYRIKPEEPKFKVGDWIRQGNFIIKVHRVESDYYYDKNNDSISVEKAVKWNPERGEYCWFWTPAENSIPKLGKFLQMERHNQYYASFGDSNYSCESNLCCEPFIGELPAHLKESK